MAKLVRKKVIYNSSLGDRLAKAARRSITGRFHVIASWRKGSWSVVQDGATRPIRVFSTKTQAIRLAKELALRTSKYSGDVVIHNRDGSIQGIESFSY